MEVDMPQPFAICIEDLDETSQRDRFLQCVALPGRGPGLRIDGSGAVRWKEEDPATIELWVSLDERLILFRPRDAARATLRRGGRALEVPAEKPVVLVDRDQIDVGGRRIRVHVHGETSRVTPPAYLRPRGRAASALTRAAAALAMGAVVGAAGCERCGEEERGPIEVREVPPAAPTTLLNNDGGPAQPPPPPQPPDDGAQDPTTQGDPKPPGERSGAE